MYAQVEVWTPERAAQVLGDQPALSNRHLRASRVQFYAEQMRAGRWRENGQTIVFNGVRLMDGQHRLQAIVASGVTLSLLTVRGVPEEVYSTIDTGLARTAGDVIRAEREYGVGSNILAAACRLAWMYEHKQDLPAGAVPNGIVLAYIDAHPGLVSSVAWLDTQTRSVVPRMALWPAFHYLCGRHPHQVDTRDRFFHALMTGEHLQAGQPAYLLRERILNFNRVSTTHRLRPRVLGAYLVKAWNAELLGTPIKILKFQPDEAFPLLAGDVRRTRD